MDREPVVSNNIESIGYNATDEVLEVEFRNGGIYQYKDVPQELYNELMEAGSVGSFLHTRIKNVFEAERIE